MIGFEAIEYAHRTDVGIRRSHNQDDFGVRLAGDVARWREHGHLFIVADGMGGHAVGEKAANKAARDIPHLVLKHAQDGPAAALRKAFLEANSAIHNIGQENPEFRGLGTTATMLWLRSEGAWVGHVGDSRAYRLRNGVIEQMTFDHSAVWELAKRQGVRPDQMQGIRANVILRSLGPEPLVEVDVEGPYQLEPGDTFLLCSDGLSGQLSDYEIGAIMSVLAPGEACDFLVELANLRGGPDNVTVVIVRVPGGAKTKDAKPGLQWRWPDMPWPTWTMVGGIAGAGLAQVLLVAGFQQFAAFVFIVAALAVFTGLAGLIIHSRKPTKVDLNLPTRANVYNQTKCTIERALIDKLAQAEGNVVERLEPGDRPAAIDAVKQLREQADAALKKNDLVSAFRFRCQAMHSLVRKFNAQHRREEMFVPVWDKSG